MAKTADELQAQVVALLQQILAVQQQQVELLRQMRDNHQPVASGPTRQQGS